MSVFRRSPRGLLHGFVAALATLDLCLLCAHRDRLSPAEGIASWTWFAAVYAYLEHA